MHAPGTRAAADLGGGGLVDAQVGVEACAQGGERAGAGAVDRIPGAPTCRRADSAQTVVSMSPGAPGWGFSRKGRGSSGWASTLGHVANDPVPEPGWGVVEAGGLRDQARLAGPDPVEPSFPACICQFLADDVGASTSACVVQHLVAVQAVQAEVGQGAVVGVEGSVEDGEAEGDDGVHDGGGDVEGGAEAGPGAQAVGHVFGKPAGVELAGGLEGGEHAAAVDGGPEVGRLGTRTEAGGVECLGGVGQLVAEGGGHRPALRIQRHDGVHHAGRDAFVVEVELAARALDASGVEQHAGRMHDRIHGAQAAGEHVGQRHDSGEKALKRRMHAIGSRGREDAQAQVWNHAPDRRLGGTGLAADVGGGVGLGHRNRRRAGFTQDAGDFQRSQGAGHQREGLVRRAGAARAPRPRAHGRRRAR